MEVYHFKNFEMLDPEVGELRGGHELVVEGDKIREVSAKPIKLVEAPRDAEGVIVRALVPALDELVLRLGRDGVAVRELAPVVSPLEAAFLALTEQGSTR